MKDIGDKIKITITTKEGKFTVSSNQVSDTLENVYTYLIIPVLLNMGYSLKDIEEVILKDVVYDNEEKLTDTFNTEPDTDIEPPEFDLVSEGYINKSDKDVDEFEKFSEMYLETYFEDDYPEQFSQRKDLFNSWKFKFRKRNR